jgi:hypothetical protein
LSRVTITTRASGRFYIGLSAEDFATLQTGYKRLDPSLITEADRRIMQAFDNFNARIRAEMAASISPIPPIES